MTQRQSVVVLGSGWAAASFLRTLDFKKYEVSVISPEECFSFTPFMCSIVGGSLPLSVAVLPFVHFLRHRSVKNIFIRGKCVRIDAEIKTVYFTRIDDASVESESTDSITYDYLVVAVGGQTNTLNIRGMKESAYFMKSADAALCIHNKIEDNFQMASKQPAIASKLLTTVIVGGGLTGVELSGEISDFIFKTLVKIVPRLVENHACVRLYASSDRLLSSMTQEMSSFTNDHLSTKCKIDISLSHKIEEVEVIKREASTSSSDEIDTTTLYRMHYLNNVNDEKGFVDCGLIICATGIAPSELANNFSAALQHESGFINVNPKLQVLGLEEKGVYALGDAVEFIVPKIADEAKNLFEEAEIEGVLSNNLMPLKWFEKRRSKLALMYPQISDARFTFKGKDIATELSLDALKDLLESIDSSYFPPPKTAASANTSGMYLGTIFNKNLSQKQKQHVKVFDDGDRASLAYIGSKVTIASVGTTQLMGGNGPLILWFFVYSWLQFSWWKRLELFWNLAKNLFYGRRVYNKELKDIDISTTDSQKPKND